jgi:hypothetical protein
VYTEKIRDNPFRNMWGGVPCSLEQKGFKPPSLTSTTWISLSHQQMALGLEIIHKYHPVFHKADSTRETDSAGETVGFECNVVWNVCELMHIYPYPIHGRATRAWMEQLI